MISPTLKQISLILDTHCNGCAIRNHLENLHGRTYSKIDSYCNKHCSFGKELQALGKQLGRGR